MPAARSESPAGSPSRPVAERTPLRRRWQVWAFALGLAGLLFVAAWASLEPPPQKDLRLAAGSSGGAYYAAAEEYRRFLARQGFELTVVETAGSVENVGLLRRGEVDLALVQGGTTGQEDRPHLAALASVFFEPVWVIHRRSLLDEAGPGSAGEEEAGPDDLLLLEGRRVGIGAPGSGTRKLALDLLAAAEVEVEARELPTGEAVRALAAGELDAAVFVASISAPFLEEVLADPELRLLSFRRHQAYRHRLPYLDRVILGEGMLDLGENLPAEDVSLLAAAATLAGPTDLHPDLVPLLLGMATEIHGDDDVFADPGTFPSVRYVDLPSNEKARHYLVYGPPFLHRFLPYRLAVEIDRLKILLLPLITLLIPLMRVAPPLYRWRIRSRIYRWYEDLRRADALFLAERPSRGEIEEALKELRRLEREVTEEVSVPLSYMQEFYLLRDHIRLVIARLEGRLDGSEE